MISDGTQLAGLSCMTRSTTGRGVLCKFEGFPRVFVQDSRRLYGLMSIWSLAVGRVKYISDTEFLECSGSGRLSYG